jgi:hypothetical protein
VRGDPLIRNVCDECPELFNFRHLLRANSVRRGKKSVSPKRCRNSPVDILVERGRLGNGTVVIANETKIPVIALDRSEDFSVPRACLAEGVPGQEILLHIIPCGSPRPAVDMSAFASLPLLRGADEYQKQWPIDVSPLIASSFSGVQHQQSRRYKLPGHSHTPFSIPKVCSSGLQQVINVVPTQLVPEILKARSVIDR